MKYRFTKHALERMAQSDITRKDVIYGIESANKIYSSIKIDTRFIAKKLHERGSIQNVLLIIFELQRKETLIITVIDSSKIGKYY